MGKSPCIDLYLALVCTQGIHHGRRTREQGTMKLIDIAGIALGTILAAYSVILVLAAL